MRLFVSYILPIFAMIFVALFVGTVGLVIVGFDTRDMGIMRDDLFDFWGRRDNLNTEKVSDNIISSDLGVSVSDGGGSVEVGAIQRVYNFRENKLDWREWGERYQLLGEERGVIALVIDDVGIKRKSDLRAISLPFPVTISLLPYSRYALSLSVRALEQGHDVFAHMPMESDNIEADPGRMALFRNMSDDDIIARTLWNLTRFDGVVGVNNHMGSKFTKWRHGMRIFLGELKQHDLLFLDSMTHPDSRGWEVAKEEGIPYIVRDVFIDHDPDVEQIRKQLRLVESKASSEGYVIAIGHSFNETIAILEDWMPKAKQKGFVFVPLTTFMVAIDEGNLARH